MATSATISIPPATSPTATALTHTPQTTAYDVQQHLMDYIGGKAIDEVSVRQCRAAIFSAYREFINAHRWSYLLKHGRIFTVAPYSTGTVTYLHSTGTVPRQLTLTLGTWPTWAASGTLVIANITYDVVSRVSSTVLQLDAQLNPGPDASISAATYNIYRDSYTLPADYISQSEGLAENSWGAMEFVNASQWLSHKRYVDSANSQAYLYTIAGDPKNPGRLAIRLWPHPDSAKTLDFLYHRRSRTINAFEYKAGTATVTASSALVTGASTAFTSDMEGSVIRLYSDATQYPDGLHGIYPYVQERQIQVRTSATSITVDENFSSSYSAVKYRISDPIDIEQGGMLEAFLRCCEKHLGIAKIMKNKPDAKQEYADALILAMDADSRSFKRRIAGIGWARLRLAQMPITFAGET